MNPSAASHEQNDMLLEYAYGELSPAARASVESHVAGCESCRRALANMASVRSTMQKLEPVAVPDTGLESLLAYAEQTAARNKAAVTAPGARHRWWLWAASLSSMAAAGVLVFRLTSPPAAAPEALAQQGAPASADSVLLRKGDSLRDGQYRPPMPIETGAEAEVPAKEKAGSGGAALGSLSESKMKRVATEGKLSKKGKTFAPKDQQALDDAMAVANEADFRNAGASAQVDRERVASAAPAPKSPADVPPMGLATPAVQAEANAAPEPAVPAPGARNSLPLPSKQAPQAIGRADKAEEQSRGEAEASTDDKSEIASALGQLQKGATGTARANLLRTLCDAYERAGNVKAADVYCDMLIREFGSTGPARAVMQRRNMMQREPAATKPAEKKAVKN
jgi:Putative zinc-finger